jgi:hypothetical protein
MDAREFDGKTLYLIEAGKRYFGAMRSAGSAATLEFAVERIATGEETWRGSMTLKPELLSQLKRNRESRPVNYWGTRIPDYYYPGDALDRFI